MSLSSKSTAIVQCDHEMIWSSAPCMEEAGQQVWLKTWISGEKILAFQGSSWKNPTGTGSAENRGPRELVNKYSSIISSRLKTSASWRVRNGTKRARQLHGWAKNSCQKWSKRYTGSESSNKTLGTNKKVLSWWDASISAEGADRHHSLKLSWSNGNQERCLRTQRK